MVVTLLFMFIDVFTVMIFWAVYGVKQTYSEGMLLGVHIPAYGVRESEVEKLMEEYKRSTKWFYIWNLIFAIGGSLFGLWYMSVFIIVWTLWLTEFTAGAIFLLYRYHRRLYEIKVKHEWYGHSGSDIIVVQTGDTTLDAKCPLSLWGQLPAIAAGIGVVFIPSVLKLFLEFEEIRIFGVIFAVMATMFMIFHAVTNRIGDKAYSGNVELNFRANKLRKRVYSIIWLTGAYLNTASWLTVLFFTWKQKWPSGWAVWGYIFFQTLAGIVVLTGGFYLAYKRRELLDSDDKPLYVDDDIYWKNGWYSNPHDKRLFVQDWSCSINSTINMAKPAGRIMTIGTLTAVAVLLVWICILFLKIDFTPVDMRIDNGVAAIQAPLSGCEFEISEIQSVSLIKELPDESFSKTNGAADDKQLIGKFRGAETGACRLYIKKGYSPVLKIELPDYTVFMNSEDSGEVKEWYRELKIKLGLAY